MADLAGEAALAIPTTAVDNHLESGPLEWVLAAAFGSAREIPRAPADSRALVMAAKRLTMSGRIDSRFAQGTLDAMIGPAAAAEFREDGMRNALQVLRLEEEVRELAKIARDVDIPVVLLKGGALHMGQFSHLRARSFVDLDVLCPRGGCAVLFHALTVRGWQATTRWRADYHLPSLRRKKGLAVELHDYIPLVHVVRRRWTTFEHLVDKGLTLQTVSLPQGVALPATKVLAAHLISHALVQHQGWTGPGSFLRCLGDLCDLGAKGDLSRRDVAQMAVLLGGYVPTAVLDLLFGLVEQLRQEPAGALRSLRLRVIDLDQRSGLWPGFGTGRKPSLFSRFLPLPGCPKPVRAALTRLCVALFMTRAEMGRSFGRGQVGVPLATLWFRRIESISKRAAEQFFGRTSALR